MSSTTRIEQYRHWLVYEADVHRLTIASLETLPTSPDGDVMRARSLRLMGHVAAARRLWLWRMGVAAEPPGALFPEGLDAAEVLRRLEAAQAAWADYLSGLLDDDLPRAFRYQSFEGDWFENTVEDILTQLFGHSWYHRGQVACFVRAAGGTPAATDYVYWTRRPIDGPIETEA